MTYTINTPPELTTADQLFDMRVDANQWRALQEILARRGYPELEPSQIATPFPNLQEPAATNQLTRERPLDSVLDAFLTPTITLPSMTPPERIHRTTPIAVHEFAEADTSMGAVTIGYSEAGELAFTFTNTGTVYLVPISAVLTSLIATLAARQPIFTRKPPRTM